MAIHCFAPNCRHNNRRDTCKFFIFPKDLIKRDKWKKTVGRSDREPGPHSYLCSCHFRDGERKNGPELFVRNVINNLSSPAKNIFHKLSDQQLDVRPVPEMDKSDLDVAASVVHPDSNSNVKTKSELPEIVLGVVEPPGCVLNVKEVPESVEVEGEVIPELAFLGQAGTVSWGYIND